MPQNSLQQTAHTVIRDLRTYHSQLYAPENEIGVGLDNAFVYTCPECNGLSRLYVVLRDESYPCLTETKELKSAITVNTQVLNGFMAPKRVNLFPRMSQLVLPQRAPQEGKREGVGIQLLVTRVSAPQKRENPRLRCRRLTGAIFNRICCFADRGCFRACTTQRGQIDPQVQSPRGDCVLP